MVTLEIALEYWRRGWSVIPLKRTNGDPENRKKSMSSWTAFQKRPPPERTVDGWFGKSQEYGIAVVLGDVSGGLVCRDFDKFQAYQNWAARYPELAETLPTVATGDNGRHVYCRSQIPISELRKRGELSDNAYFDLGDGECRIDRCYCALPPTMHPNGERYSWLNPPTGGVPQIDFLGGGFRQPWDVTERDGEAQRLPRTTECHDEGSEESLPPTIVERSDFGSKPMFAGEIAPSGIASISLASRLGPTVEDIIVATLPEHEGERNRKLFDLARSLKAVPEFCEAQAGDLKEVVRLWHSRALVVIGTKSFDASWTDFVHGWKRVKFPKGQEPMMQIVARALSQPLPPEAEQYDSEPTRNLVCICRELSRTSHGGVFFLSVRTAGKLVGVSHMQASRLFEMMQFDGLLAVAELGSHKTLKATRFRYLGTR